MSNTSNTKRFFGWTWKRWIAALAVVVAVAAVIIGINLANQGQPVDPDAVSATTPTASAEPSTSAEPSPATDPATAPATDPGPESTPAAPEAGTAPAAPAPVAPTVPAPAPSNEAELATIDQPVAPPVEITAKSTVVAGVTAQVTGIESVQGEAKGIGEVAGPAIRFTLTVTNGTAEAVSLANAIVNVEAGEQQAPASSLSGPGTVPFPVTVEAGKTASGTFVFAVPVQDRGRVSIYLNYSVTAPIVAFVGPVPN